MLIEDVRKIYQDCFQEFVVLMQKFEVVFRLDDSRLVIPSLLPPDEEHSCLVFSRAISQSQCLDEATFRELRNQPHAPMYETPHVILNRFYLLPFVPNGFFSRLIARLLSGDTIDKLQGSLLSNQLSQAHISNTAHWKCWRSGILITWNHMEIFRIAPLDHAPSAGLGRVCVVTKKDTSESTEVSGLEIKVAVLPEEYIECPPTSPSPSSPPHLQASFSTSGAESERRGEGTHSFRGKCLATWLLHQATIAIDSVFEDWYESFARKKGFDPHQENVRIANPCNMCMQHVQELQLTASRPAVGGPSSPVGGEKELEEEGERGEGSDGEVCYVFTSKYATHVCASSGEELVCPSHGPVSLTEVAPDLVSQLLSLAKW